MLSVKLPLFAQTFVFFMCTRLHTNLSVKTVVYLTRVYILAFESLKRLMLATLLLWVFSEYKKAEEGQMIIHFEL